MPLLNCTELSGWCCIDTVSRFHNRMSGVASNIGRRERKVVGVKDTFTEPSIHWTITCYNTPEILKTVHTFDWHAIDKELFFRTNAHDFGLFDVYRQTHPFCHGFVGCGQSLYSPSAESLKIAMSSAYCASLMKSVKVLVLVFSLLKSKRSPSYRNLIFMLNWWPTFSYASRRSTAA